MHTWGGQMTGQWGYCHQGVKCHLIYLNGVQLRESHSPLGFLCSASSQLWPSYGLNTPCTPTVPLTLMKAWGSFVSTTTNKSFITVCCTGGAYQIMDLFFAYLQFLVWLSCQLTPLPSMLSLEAVIQIALSSIIPLHSG